PPYSLLATRNPGPPDPRWGSPTASIDWFPKANRCLDHADYLSAPRGSWRLRPVRGPPPRPRLLGAGRGRAPSPLALARETGGLARASARAPRSGAATRATSEGRPGGRPQPGPACRDNGCDHGRENPSPGER